MAETDQDIHTWDQFLLMEGTKEEKLEILKKNHKLLFSNPGTLRGQSSFTKADFGIHRSLKISRPRDSMTTDPMVQVEIA